MEIEDLISELEGRRRTFQKQNLISLAISSQVVELEMRSRAIVRFVLKAEEIAKRVTKRSSEAHASKKQRST